LRFKKCGRKAAAFFVSLSKRGRTRPSPARTSLSARPKNRTNRSRRSTVSPEAITDPEGRFTFEQIIIDDTGAVFAGKHPDDPPLPQDVVAVSITDRDVTDVKVVGKRR
jgi:hypothetical protein